ncbi:unnamed protein product, partial [Prorocentrum cordatum]
QERYRAITSSHYRRAVGALLVYDVTRQATFHNCLKWLEELRQNAEPSLTVMLVGNKVDLVEKDPKSRQVYHEAAVEFAQQHGLLFKEASAVTDYNVKPLFEHLLQEVYNREVRAVKPERPASGLLMRPGGAGEDLTAPATARRAEPRGASGPARPLRRAPGALVDGAPVSQANVLGT